MSKKLVVIVGPTAVGKTAVAIEVAQRYRTAIVSADSRQIFKEMTIGTAKPTNEELARVPHYFINSHSIKEKYNAAQFGEEALQKIRELFEKHDVVIMCGGSGLYVKAVLEGFDDIPAVPDEVRQYISEQFRTHGVEWLQSKLKEVDPDQLARLDASNPMRLMRALEVRMGTGTSISSFHKKEKRSHPFEVVKIGLNCDRAELYRRIEKRVDVMIDRGLFWEAESLLPYKDSTPLQTVGYQEIFGYLDGSYGREEAIRLLKRNTRRYAKRQLTWFGKDTEIHWVKPNDLETIFTLIERDPNQLVSGN